LHCPRCAGTGTCPDCKGEGFQECPACSGEGTRQTSRGQSYNCRSCAGQGTVACPRECSSCEGTGEITEELQKKVRDTYTVRFQNFTPGVEMTTALVAVNAVMFVLGQIWPQFHSETILHGDVLLSGHYWQFLSSSFQHAGLLHILLNMGFLWSYGPLMEGLLGRMRYLGLYLGCGLSAALISWAGHNYLDGISWASTGASGALFGFDGAFLAFYWRWRLLPWEPVRSLSSWAAIVFCGGILAQMGGFNLLDNWAHAGGFVAGFIIAAVLPRPRGR
jgi:rhomboid protease GluP